MSRQKRKPTQTLPEGAMSSIQTMIEQAIPPAVNKVLADPTPKAATPKTATPKTTGQRSPLVAPTAAKPTRRTSEFEEITRREATRKVMPLSQLSRMLGRSNGYLTSVFAGHSPVTQDLIRNVASILESDAYEKLLSPQSKAKINAASAPEEGPPAIPTELISAVVREDPEPALGVPATVGVASLLPQSTSVQAPGSSVQDIIEAAAKPTTIRTVRMTITPAIAKVFLQNNKTNRPISTGHVQWFAKQINDNEWDSENGESIKFSPDGNLLDGQHRLMGIVLANIDVECDVQFGVPQTSQATIDVGRKRTIGDQLSISGEKYGNQVAATVRWIFAISNGTIAYKTSTPEVKRFIERYPSITDAVGHVKSQKFVGTIPTLLCALHFIAREALQEHDRAEAFLKVFTTGYPSYEGDPAHRVREMYIEARTKGNTVTQARQAANLIHAWNLFRKGTSVKSIRLPSATRIEGFDPAVLGISTEARIPAQTVRLEDGTPILQRA